MKRTMKLLLFFSALFPPFAAFSHCDSLLVVSWNVENFLDPRTDSTGRYTTARLRTKCNAISKTLLLIASRHGRLPDAVALMEVGDRYVLERLLRDTPLYKLDYSIVHYDSPDRRGIDCALLYRRSTLRLLRSAPKHLYDSTGAIMSTRDILVAEFEGLDILVNHHPSKVGVASGPKRAIAWARMRYLMDSLACSGSFLEPPEEYAGSGQSKKSAGCGRAILAVGDFNDDLWPHEGPRTAFEGTIKYNGTWEKIDGFFSAGPISVIETVFSDSLLSEEDKNYGGTKPRRSFSGPRYIGGISDHYPLILRIVITK